MVSGPGTAAALGFSPRAAASFGGSADRIVVSFACAILRIIGLDWVSICVLAIICLSTLFLLNRLSVVMLYVVRLSPPVEARNRAGNTSADFFRQVRRIHFVIMNC